MADTELESKTNSDAEETSEWIASLDYILKTRGGERAAQLLDELREHLRRQGVRVPFTANTPYVNTIPVDEQPPYPGSRELERRIKSLIRWNAMAMVVRPLTRATRRGNDSAPASAGRSFWTSWSCRLMVLVEITTRRPCAAA